jgi:hypothetical protein
VGRSELPAMRYPIEKGGDWSTSGSWGRPMSEPVTAARLGKIHRVDLTDDYDTTIYDVARRLLAEGADTGDRVETRRNGVFSMSGIVGELAKWQVVFRGSGPCLVRYAASTSGPPAPETAEPVSEGPAYPSRPSAGRPHELPPARYSITRGHLCSGRRLLMGVRPRLADHGASLARWTMHRPWRARVYVGGKDLHLGYFATREEAKAAHAAAVKAYLGEKFLRGLAADES